MAKDLVFTDLDGTLLDHCSYRFDAALEMIAYLKEHHIPIIITTSKTRSEVVKIRKALGIEDPFIVENGAGAFLPMNSALDGNDLHDTEWVMVSQAKTYETLRKFFMSVQERFKLRGFGDMHLDEVMERTGLNASDAEDAMQRDFTEPFVMEEPETVEALVPLAQKQGLDIVKGGRFFHLVTQSQSKGRAMQSVAALYASHYNERVCTIALGDSANDFSMLKAADEGVLIPQVDGSYAPLVHDGIIKAPFPGPQGWNAALKERFRVL